MNEHVERLLKSLEEKMEQQLIDFPNSVDVTKGQLFIVRLIKESIETMKPYLK